MDKRLKPGDRVKWNSSGREAVGEIVREVTPDTKKAKARKDLPQYVVRADMTGKEAVHRADALKRA